MVSRAIAFALLVACGLGFILYPQADAWLKEREENRIAFHTTQGQQLSTNEQIIADAQQYNVDLTIHPHTYGEPANISADTEYRSQLQFGTRAMSELYIPKLDVKVPVYHGTGVWELEHGAGHLYGSSLPVGGASTHTVITAHAGMPRDELFTRLADLVVGDEFTITTGWLNLTYRVNDIKTVLPDEVDSLAVVPGKDLATLVTCTPIGLNTHRLLVTGERVLQPLQPTAPENSWHMPWWAIIFSAGVLGAFGSGMMLFRVPAKHGRHRVSARAPQRASGRGQLQRALRSA